MPGKSSVPARKRATATSSAAISAARGARTDPAGLAGDPERREAASSGARKSSRRDGDEVRRRRRRRAPRRVGHGVLDREPHVRGAQLGLERAVDEVDGRVDDALRMDDDVDRVVGDIVQPVRLDDLQALVGEGGRVDRDLGPHRPGRVAQGIGRGDRREASAGVSRNGPPDAVSTSRATARHRFADEALPDRGVLRIDGAEPAERAGERVLAGRARPRAAARARASAITRWPPATRVSLLAVATTLPARSAARTGRRLTTPPVADHHEVDVVARGELARGASAPRTCRRQPAGRSRRRVGADGGRCRAEAPACSSRSADWLPVARATTRSSGPGAARTSTAWRPIEPPDPRSATPTGRRSAWRAASAMDDGATPGRTATRGGEQERVDPVQDPAVTGDQGPGVLGAGRALEHRLGEVAGLGRERRRAAPGRAPQRDAGRDHEDDRHDDGGRDEPADEALVASSTARCASGTGAARMRARRGRRRCRTPRRQDSRTRIQPRSGQTGPRANDAGSVHCVAEDATAPSRPNVDRPEDRRRSRPRTRRPGRAVAKAIIASADRDHDEREPDGRQQRGQLPASASARSCRSRGMPDERPGRARRRRRRRCAG